MTFYSYLQKNIVVWLSFEIRKELHLSAPILNYQWMSDLWKKKVSYRKKILIHIRITILFTATRKSKFKQSQQVVTFYLKRNLSIIEYRAMVTFFCLSNTSLSKTSYLQNQYYQISLC